ncbi:MAG: PepSY domain-containing protein [Acetobacteraceae bacterium]|nr:PepSY domain-containing protein [Acetobacteraceae bacterium]
MQRLSNARFAIVGIALALVLLVGGVIVVGWGGDRGAADTSRPGWISEGEVTQNLEADGYRVRKIEDDDGRYKVKVTTRDGHKEKLYVNPKSGARVSAVADDEIDTE